MEKTHMKSLRTAARSITTDARRLKKAVNVLHALDGFTGDGNGELHEAARTELTAAAASLRSSLDRIANVIAIGADDIAIDANTIAGDIADHTNQL